MVARIIFLAYVFVVNTDVRQNTELLEREFKDLRCQLVSELNHATHISVDSILDSLTTLPIFLRPQYENPLQGKLPVLERASSVNQLFRRLDPLLSFIDYPGLLCHLISIFGSRNLRRELEYYESKIKIFLSETTVADLMDFWPGRQYSDFAKLRVKFDGDPKSYTLEKLNEVRRRFASELRLSELIFVLIGCERSTSFVVIWMVHPSTVHSIVERSKQIKDDFYLAEKILYMSIDETQLYCKVIAIYYNSGNIFEVLYTIYWGRRSTSLISRLGSRHIIFGLCQGLIEPPKAAQ